MDSGPHPSALRTPDERFANLPDFPYGPHYVHLPGFEKYRMAYIDERTPNYRPGQSPTFLCLHGVPTWSYLYRKMIPQFLASDQHHQQGVRVVCPDFIGWGRSDKPKDRSVHTIHFQRHQLEAFIKTLDLRNITLVIQDWGSILGFFMACDPQVTPRLARLIHHNAGIPDGTAHKSKAFMAWRQFAGSNANLDVGWLIGRTPGTDVCTREELDGYRAPFPGPEYQAAVQQWPCNVPAFPDSDGMVQCKEAMMWWSSKWNGKTFQAHGLMDTIFTKKTAKAMNMLIRNGPPEEEILWVPQAGHFIQDAAGAYVARKALEAFGDIPRPSARVTWVDKNVAELCVDVPPANALGVSFFNDARRAVTELDNDPRCRAFIFSAVDIPGKDSLFSAGIDLRVALSGDRTKIEAFWRALFMMLRTFTGLRTPIIAKLRGTVFAGAVVSALACDYRVSSEEATFGLNEALIGYAAGRWLFLVAERVVGPARAQQLLETGRFINTTQAIDFGLIDEVCTREDLSTCALKAAKRFYKGGGTARSRMSYRQFAYEKLNAHIDANLDDMVRESTDNMLHPDCVKSIAKILKTKSKKKKSKL